MTGTPVQVVEATRWRSRSRLPWICSSQRSRWEAPREHAAGRPGDRIPSRRGNARPAGTAIRRRRRLCGAFRRRSGRPRALRRAAERNRARRHRRGVRTTDDPGGWCWAVGEGARRSGWLMRAEGYCSGTWPVGSASAWLSAQGCARRHSLFSELPDALVVEAGDDYRICLHPTIAVAKDQCHRHRIGGRCGRAGKPSAVGTDRAILDMMTASAHDSRQLGA